MGLVQTEGRGLGACSWDACARCASMCECCGRSAEERGYSRVLCEGLCRECIERDFVFDEVLCEWMAIDSFGECADCDVEDCLFSVGDGLVCLDCFRAARERRAAA
jgi:hypothetical protein